MFPVAAAAARAAPPPALCWLRRGFLRCQADAQRRVRTAAASASSATPQDSDAPPDAAPAAPTRHSRKPAALKSAAPAAGGEPARASRRRGASAPLAQPPTLQQEQQQQAGPLQLADGPDGPDFSSVSGWVVFSDLHVSHRSLDVCMDVLKRVHQESAARGAGVLFLGDFWDRRGDLPVGPLNQVDQAGRHHSLTPLAAVCRRAHVFTEPSHYAGALWLPYRRDEAVLRAALAAAAGRGATKAIFAHADTMGAHMNAAHQASSGLPTDAFPLDIPVFMGHYHMPQTVPGTRITYIGSPYQVSRSEAGQSKRLLLLSPEWQAVADIPLEMGPRHFTFATTTGPSADPSAAADGSDTPSDLLTAAASAAPAAATPDCIRELLAGGRLRAGDRVRVAVADGRAVDDMAELQKGMAAADTVIA